MENNEEYAYNTEADLYHNQMNAQQNDLRNQNL